MATYGIIGGTGVYNLGVLTGASLCNVDTPYGRVPVTTGYIRGTQVAFVARHGRGHAVPPHLVNYRGNIWALRELGVGKVISTFAVGSMRPEIKPGEAVVLGQFIDFTKNRISTFSEGDRQEVRHQDMTEPYCPGLSRLLAGSCGETGLRVHEGVCYVCTEGPRFETAAEIRAFVRLGGDVVGMTGVPEVCLAREAEMCFAGLGIATNYAAGISTGRLHHGEVSAKMDAMLGAVAMVLEHTVAALGESAGQPCQYCSSHSAQGSGGQDDPGPAV